MSAQLAFGADFARHPGYFAGKRIELINHGVDRIFQFEDFALDVDGNLPRQVAPRHSRCHFSDVANLRGQITGHRIDRIGKVLPGACDTGHVGLTAQPAFGADLAGHTSDFACKGIELIHGSVNGFLEQKNFTADVHGNFFG